jgi:hypothetical protein
MGKDKSPKRQKEEHKRSKHQKCEHCQFGGCYSLENQTKVPTEGVDGYEIADKKSKRWLCCRCIQVLDMIINRELSEKRQCAMCKHSTRACTICKQTICKDLSAFDGSYEGLADEEGFYCCNHRAYSRTFNDGRCEVIKCRPCKRYVTCDIESEECKLVDSSNGEYHCKTCNSERFLPLDCECCGNDCCLQCHDHDTYGQPEMVICRRCSDECNPREEDYWHDKNVPDKQDVEPPAQVIKI